MTKILQRPSAAVSTDIGISYDDVLIVPTVSEIQSRQDCDTTTDISGILYNIPFANAPMDTVASPEVLEIVQHSGGIGITHRNCSITDQVNTHKQSGARWAAIGLNQYDRALELSDSNYVDWFVIDVANGGTTAVGEFVKRLKRDTRMKVMAGSLATGDVAKYLIDCGADGLRVGIGPGALCTTRIIAGVGVPQLSALREVINACSDRIVVCADGGIRHPGDAAKALAAGADMVMIGSLLGRTSQAPGERKEVDGVTYKELRGMASSRARNWEGPKDYRAAEGVSTMVEVNASALDVLNWLTGGVRSAMSYSDSATLDEFRRKALLRVVSTASRSESVPHILTEPLHFLD